MAAEAAALKLLKRTTVDAFEKRHVVSDKPKKKIYAGICVGIIEAPSFFIRSLSLLD